MIMIGKCAAGPSAADMELAESSAKSKRVTFCGCGAEKCTDAWYRASSLFQ